MYSLWNCLLWVIALTVLGFQPYIKVSRLSCNFSQKNKRTNLFFYPDDLEILETWNRNSSFKYFRVIRIEKQIRPFIFWEKLQLDNFVSRSTVLYTNLPFPWNKTWGSVAQCMQLVENLSDVAFLVTWIHVFISFLWNIWMYFWYFSIENLVETENREA